MSVEEIFKIVRDLVAEQFAIDPAEVSMDTHLEDDLNADSVDLADLTIALEEELGLAEVELEEFTGIATVGDVVNFCAAQLK